MPDPTGEQIDLAQRLAADLGRVSWPPVEEIKAVARRRSRRSALAASLSVLLLLSGVWVVTARPFQTTAEPTLDAFAGTPPPVATTIGPDDPAWIPPEALLTPEDVGPGLIASPMSTDQDRPVGAWAFSLTPCPAYRSVRTYGGVYQFRREQTVEYPPKIAGKPDTAMAVLHQSVMRVPGGGAQELVEGAREAAKACAKYESSGMAAITDDRGTVDKQVKVSTTHAWALLDENFAGDQSLLFQHRMIANLGVKQADLGDSAVAVIRVGDLVATVEQVNGESPATTRKLAARAATWLCTAAAPPC
jgi:hypothetical protein